MSQQRIEHLDSVRGLAALSVVFGHTLVSYKSLQYDFIYSVTAHSAVIFFFLLSGFVLSRSLLKKRELTIVGLIAYGIRRIFRLYPMMVAALLFGALVITIIELPINPEFYSHWFREQIINAKSVIHMTDYVNELTMQHQFLNPPLWTIRAELQCSVVLPFLIILQQRGKYFGMVLGLGLAMYLFIDKAEHKSSFLFAFYLGHLINVFYSPLSIVTSKMTKILLTILIPIWMLVASDWFVNTLILSLIFALIVHCPWIGLKNFLDRPSLQFLGKISFSFYALHMPVLFLVWVITDHLIARFIPSLPIVAMGCIVFTTTVFLTIPLSALTERFIERPWNLWGHYVAGLFEKINKPLINNPN